MTATVNSSSTRRASLPQLPLESAYEAGSGLAGWDRDAPRSAWWPEPNELSEIPGR